MSFTRQKKPFILRQAPLDLGREDIWFKVVKNRGGASLRQAQGRSLSAEEDPAPGVDKN
jgi:hypothetical protein